MPWNVGLVVERVTDTPPALQLPSYTDFTGLSALPDGWSQVSGGTIQFFADGIGSSNGLLRIDKSTSFLDFASYGGGYMYLHLKRGAPTGGSTGGQLGRYGTNPTLTENLTGVPGYASSSAFGVPIYGGGFFRREDIVGSEQTTAVFSPVVTGIQDLWLAGFRPASGPSRFYMSNGVSGVSQVVVGGAAGLAPVISERVEILSGTDIRICQTYMNFGTRTFAQMIQEWQSFMGYP
jgi:hypothetical protein